MYATVVKVPAEAKFPETSGHTRLCDRWDTRKPGERLARGTASPEIADLDRRIVVEEQDCVKIRPVETR
jgi:hypothetical protein